MQQPPRSKREAPPPLPLPKIAGLNISDELLASKALQTPFMRQWFAAKERYPDALIFFRMGDFYELFLDDAVRASQLLGLTLTSRNKGEADEIPMAGAPHHNAHTYVARAIKHGLSVAICEQMADPAKVKGIVPREVVRVAVGSYRWWAQSYRWGGSGAPNSPAHRPAGGPRHSGEDGDDRPTEQPIVAVGEGHRQ